MSSQSRSMSLGLEGKIVSRCYIDLDFGIQFFQGEYMATITVGTRFSLTINGDRFEIVPSDLTALCRAIHIVRKTIAQAVARDDGTLEMVFTDGTELIVPPAAEHETWSFISSDGMLLAPFPGEGLG